MAKSKEQKKEIVKSLTERLKSARLLVLSNIKGLNVFDTTKLRSELRKQEVGHQVVKLSLLKLALRKAGISTDNLDVHTQVAVSYCEDDTAAARELRKFSAGNDKLEVLGGFLEGRYLNQSEMVRLASIPGRTELLGQLANILSGPARGVVVTLAGNLRGMLRVLSQVKK